MAKYFTLSIPEPCSENWDRMTASPGGRFCDSCTKTVIDFTHLPDNAIAAHLKNKPEHICGRFHPDQLDRAILIPKKPWPLAKYFLTVSFPAFILSMKTSAQKSIIAGGISISAGKSRSAKAPAAERILRGSVKDENDFPVRGASVVIKGTMRGTTADSAGNFILNLPEGQITISVSAIAFEIKEYSVSGMEDLKITLRHMAKQEAAVTVSTMGMVLGRLIRSVTISKNNQKAEALNSLDIFPNPVLANSTLHFSLDRNAGSTQLIEVFAANGNLVQKETVITTKGEGFVHIGRVAKGFYILRATDRINRKIVSKEFIVR